MAASIIDLTTIEGVRKYLMDTPFAASRVELLTGGTTNFTYRIVLSEPYQEKDETSSPIHTMVLKHAEPYVAINKNFHIAVERQEFEVLAFRKIPKSIPSSPIVAFPTVYFEDPERHVLIITDCGDNSITLKELLREGPLSLEVSRDIGDSLGLFLARLHAVSHSSRSSDSPGIVIKDEFSGNKQGREISAFVTHGRVISTLVPKDPNSSLVNPPLNVSAAQLDTLGTVTQEMQERIRKSSEVLTMGDFWPGNILVSGNESDGIKVHVIDWELAKPGTPGLDIGQFLAELSQMRDFHPSSSASVDATTAAFTRAYREEIGRTCHALDLVEVAKIAGTHLGAHLIAFTPTRPWGGAEKTREVVQKGVEYILKVAEGDEKWLRSSIVGGLLV